MITIKTRHIKGSAGFTLVEVVVVIAVVALLSAIMTPLIAKSIDDAKEGQATNEAHVIAAALGPFYMDVGGWPTMGLGGTRNTITTLVSGSPNNLGTPINGNGWLSDTTLDTVDFLDNHLAKNAPKGVASGYPDTGKLSWKGPYLSSVPLDPWGTPYLINIAATTPGNGVDKGLVISAGRNGTVDTPFNTSLNTEIQGDDVGIVFTVER